MREKIVPMLLLTLTLLTTSQGSYGATWKKLITTATTGTAGTALISAQCPVGYVFVPKNITYTAVDFCVMKYAASNDGYGTAVSVATGQPWVLTNHPTSRLKCQAQGAGYDMISNDQWQTIARNIAGVAVNWSTGIAYSGQLSHGHSDSNPGSALVASTDDVNGNCSGEGAGACSSTIWSTQRRTNVLSNGSIVWDIAGNVWEWVTNDNTVVNGADGFISTMSGGDIRQTRYGAAAGTFCADPTVPPYCGMGNGMFNYTTGAVLRGGSWTYGKSSGVFAALLDKASTVIATAIGFRCVFVP